MQAIMFMESFSPLAVGSMIFFSKENVINNLSWILDS